MGRSKVPIKLIQDAKKRNLRYTCRKRGLIKKVYELATLCEVDVALIMFSPSRKLTAFCKDGKINKVMSLFRSIPAAEIDKSITESNQRQAEIVQKLARLESEDPTSNTVDTINTVYNRGHPLPDRVQNDLSSNFEFEMPSFLDELHDSWFLSTGSFLPEGFEWDSASNFKFEMTSDLAEGHDEGKILNSDGPQCREYPPNSVESSEPN